MFDPAFALLAAIVFGAFAVQSISGFGSVVLSVTFGAHLFAIPELLPLLVPLGLGQCAYLATRHRDAIDWRLVLGRVAPLMGGGTVLGLILFETIEGDLLRRGFAVLVLGLAIWELTRLLRPRRPHRPLGAVPFGASLVAAGVTHGVYASGGPLLVYALGRSGMAKRAFRSTLLVIWVVLNTVLIVQYARAGRFDAGTGLGIALLAPVVVAGVLAGEWAHDRVEEHTFRIVVFVLLAAAALALLVR